MKMKKYLSAIMLFAVPFLFTSCIEDDYVKLTDQGDSFVRISGSAEKKMFFSAFTNVKKIEIVDFARDVPSQAKLNEKSTVKLKASPEAVEEYNKKNGTDYLWLDPAIATFVQTPGLVINGNDVTLEYTAGDFAKAIAINLDGSKWDLAKKYALAYKITDAGNLKISGKDEVIVFINAKNAYDGKYKVLDGFVQRYTSPTSPTTGDALNGSLVGNPNVTLGTIDPNTVSISGLNWAASGGGVGGIDGLRAKIDPVTNKVTMSATGNATLKVREGMENSYNPKTRTLTLNFDWNQTSTKREYGLVIQWVSESN